jgi:hypothetical protein
MTVMIYFVLAQVAVFAVLAFGMRQWVLSDTLKATLKLREAENELGRKEESVRKRIEDNETEFRRKSAEAQEELAKAREAMEKNVARSRDALLEDARKERDRIMDDANRGREKLRQELVREAQVQTLDHAGRIYEMVFSDDVGRALDQAFMDELLVALEEMEAGNITISAAAIEVACSRSLEAAQRDRLRAIVARKFNVTLDVRETVEPGLIAGVKIKLGSLEIDGSLQNRFNEAIEQLKGEHA